MVMEFVPYQAADNVPFPDRFDPIEGMPNFFVESLSIPHAARALGRMDEPWLTQVIVTQKVMNFHFAVVSPIKVVEFQHLQMSVKTQPEIDAIFWALVRLAEQDTSLRSLVLLEAKQMKQRILEDQIREQAAKAFEFTRNRAGAGAIDAIIPVVVKVDAVPIAGVLVRGIYVCEFQLLTREIFEENYLNDNLHEMPLVVAARAFYVLRPNVGGISNDGIGAEDAIENDDE